MGLDIYLIKIVKNSKSKMCWISEGENLGLKKGYSSLLAVQKFESETEKGYYYDEIAHQWGRRSVKPLFYEKFKSDDFIFSTPKLLELHKCVANEYLQSFELDFMKKFKEKEHLFLISY